MDFSTIGKLLLIVAGVIAVIGAILLLIGGTPVGAFLRDLPGTIRIQGSGFSCIIPIVASILLSVVLTVILNIVIRLINRP